MEDAQGLVVVSAWHEYVGGTRGSGIVSSAADVLEMCVVHVMIEVCEMCECLCVWLGGRCRR